MENSRISSIKFQTVDASCCQEGMLVDVRLGDRTVYYQVTQGTTVEESIESSRHGFQVASASQLGVLDLDRGFTKYPWLPAMNSPVFSLPSDFGGRAKIVKEGDFVYGKMPMTSLDISGQFADMLEYHTAILGITGSGKTELAFDLIRHAAAVGVKVICVDLTRLYEGRLAELSPRNLSISQKDATDLGVKLFDVETGTYGAPGEKKALSDFTEALRGGISEKIKDFLEAEDGESRVGIITLEEISNTKATICLTEVYLTCILNYARDNHGKSPKVLIVLEEAHTVVPESSTMGLGDWASKGTVAKIAQIGLQGRKYGVGLLVIGQRTATVSKTVLTQCNTIISFACFDETSLGFLRNIFGEEHVAIIPDLPFLHAVVFGKGVRAERPIVVEIPFDPNKGPGQEKPKIPPPPNSPV